MIALAPRLEVRCELVVRYDINRFKIWNIYEAIDDPFDNRFAATNSRGFGLSSVTDKGALRIPQRELARS